MTINSEEFTRLFLSCQDKFIAIAQSYVRDELVAQDIVAECFTNFWDRRESVDIGSSSEAYILRSVKNRCLNHLRDRAGQMPMGLQIEGFTREVLLKEIDILSTEDIGIVFRDEIAGIFRETMASLPEMTREIFASSRFDELTYQEISAKYGVSPRKVKREIQKVLKTTRHRLKDYLPKDMLWEEPNR